MKSVIFSLTCLFFASHSFAQETPSTDWKITSNAGLNLAQSHLSNWAGGGESSIATTAIFGSKFLKNFEDYYFETVIDLKYGLVKQGDKDFRKSDDQLAITSKLGTSLFGSWNLTALTELRTQFDAGFKYETDPLTQSEIKSFVSKFMAPGYLTVLIGLEYRPQDNFSLLVTPITGKSTFVLDDALSNAGAYGVSPGNKTLHQFGATFIGNYKTILMENVTFSTKLGLFTAYDKIQYIDVNWETLLLLKVNEYVNASLSTNLIYDDDIAIKRDDATIGPATQFKEVIAIGMSYSF